MDILILLVSLVILLVGGEFFIKGSSQLANRLGISPMITGLTIVSLGTSAPELGVSIKASLIGNNSIAIGNVVGSNIFNILFILGICSIISPLRVKYQLMKIDVPVMILAAILLALLVLDKEISFSNGLTLLFCAGVYLTTTIKMNKGISEEIKTQKTALYKIVLFMTIGLAALIFGSDILVSSAINISKYFGVSDKVIGLTVIAAGTSLPELITSAVATYKGEKEIAVGNVIGSNILNIFVILGASTLFSSQGLTLQESILNIDIPIMILISILAWPLMLTGYQIDRKEGVLFVTSYIFYLGYLISSN